MYYNMVRFYCTYTYAVLYVYVNCLKKYRFKHSKIYTVFNLHRNLRNELIV
jgi:hypothetical protein